MSSKFPGFSQSALSPIACNNYFKLNCSNTWSPFLSLSEAGHNSYFTETIKVIRRDYLTSYYQIWKNICIYSHNCLLASDYDGYAPDLCQHNWHCHLVDSKVLQSQIDMIFTVPLPTWSFSGLYRGYHHLSSCTGQPRESSLTFSPTLSSVDIRFQICLESLHFSPSLLPLL